jgi:hypothetical protein
MPDLKLGSYRAARIPGGASRFLLAVQPFFADLPVGCRSRLLDPTAAARTLDRHP